MRPRYILLAAALVAAVVYAAFHSRPPGTKGESPPPQEGPDHALFVKNLERPSDPELKVLYDKVNSEHFGGALPSIPIHWEAGLNRRGDGLAPGFELQGLWLSEGEDAQILINPGLRNDSEALLRTLCHEIAHEYLFTRGDSKSSHGPPFQAVLRRLWAEGAFTGVMASDEERAQLKAWLDERRVVLDDSDWQVEEARRQFDEAEGAFQNMNARIQAANEAHAGWPDQSEITEVESKRNLLAARYNSMVSARNDAVTEFNEAAERYNLMRAYPDGLDGERVAAYPVSSPTSPRE